MARVYLSPPDVGELEREALLRAFDSGWIAPVGPELDGFERDIAELTGWPGAVALSSGTAALHLALLVSGVQPGDDVFVSTFTFAATANAVIYCGAHPVFIDSETTSWSMSPELLAEALHDAKRRNKLPAAVVVVDLYGQCADYGAIAPICHELGIPIIEDAAEALGATHLGRPAGTVGDIGVYSFNGNKIVTTSGGGMLITPDEAVAERVRYLSTQARLPAVHYEHEEVGYNYRLSNLLAALGRAQLSRLDEFVARKREIAARYDEELAGTGLVLPPRVPGMDATYWLYSILAPEDLDGGRDALLEKLMARGVGARALWRPLHAQPPFRSARVVGSGQTSEALFDRGLSLPCATELTDDDQSRVIDAVLTALA